MTKKTPIPSLLNDSRWASRMLSADDSDFRVYLTTFPGLVGGVFRAQVIGLSPDYFGQVGVMITCTTFDFDDSQEQSSFNSSGIDFQEAESLTVRNSSFDINFLIPFEAQATEEGAVWHLIIQFGNGTTETFEVPVCRTQESKPEMTSVQIATMRVEPAEQQRLTSEKTPSASSTSLCTIETSDGKLNMRFPSRIPGRVSSLAKGLGVFIGLWVAMTGLMYWLLDGPLDLIAVFGTMTLIMVLMLLFMLVGVSHCTLDKKSLKTTHKLFGLPLNWRKINRENLVGFYPKLLTVIPAKGKSQLHYLVMAQTKSGNVFLCLTTFHQYEVRVLIRRLNEYLKNTGSV